MPARAVDLRAFNIQDTRPELVRRIKDLQPEASNRAIAEAIGVSEITVRRDTEPATNVAPEPAEIEDEEEAEDDAEEADEPEDDAGVDPRHADAAALRLLPEMDGAAVAANKRVVAGPEIG